MSRIDEALRRSGPSNPEVAPAPDQDVFVSAWDSMRPSKTADPAPISPAATVHEAPAPPRAPAAKPEDRSASSVLTLNRAWREFLATSPQADPVFVEQFRALAATLHRAQQASRIRVIMLTSGSANDGKTLTALNLALVLSESYHRRVLLIDADLRRPSLGRIANLNAVDGLSEALKATTEQKLSLVQLSPTLMLLPAGRPDPDPMGTLTSSRMRFVIEEAAERFDWVILDAPPMSPMADASLLAQIVDGAVFVVRAGESQYPVVKRAIDALGRDKILGVVLNGVRDLPPEQYAYYHADSE